MIRPALALAVLLAPAAADAAPCPPSATLGGDTALVAAVGGALSARGIAAGDDACPGVHASLAAQGGAIAVSIEPGNGTPIERVVSSSDLAATVIESWARTDVDQPLLAVRDAPPVVVRVARVTAPDVPAPIAVVTHATPQARGIELFASGQTALGSDLTTWVGVEVGGCVGIGPVCVAVRLRVGGVATGPGEWSRTYDRNGAEVLIGGDLPFARGPLTITGGIAAGLGSIHTHVEDAGRHVGGETGGVRGDLHGALAYRLARHLAAEVSLAFDVTQATHVETNTTIAIPDEPWLLVRLGAGLRVGGL